jgi:clan AA aspartic protease
MRIDGYFNENDEPVIKLDAISASIEVLIDTGFAGSLIIPQQLSTELTLHFEGFEEFYTVTGHVFVAPAYAVEINWLGEHIKVAVAVSADIKEALLGSQMLKNCRLTIDYANRTVNVERKT